MSLPNGKQCSEAEVGKLTLSSKVVAIIKILQRNAECTHILSVCKSETFSFSDPCQSYILWIHRPLHTWVMPHVVEPAGTIPLPSFCMHVKTHRDIGIFLKSSQTIGLSNSILCPLTGSGCLGFHTEVFFYHPYRDSVYLFHKNFYTT